MAARRTSGSGSSRAAATSSSAEGALAHAIERSRAAHRRVRVLERLHHGIDGPRHWHLAEDLGRDPPDGRVLAVDARHHSQHRHCIALEAPESCSSA